MGAKDCAVICVEGCRIGAGGDGQHSSRGNSQAHGRPADSGGKIVVCSVAGVEERGYVIADTGVRLLCSCDVVAPHLAMMETAKIERNDVY